MISARISQFALNFDCPSVTGKLNYLAQTLHPDIMYAIHQIAKYSFDPRLPHGDAIIYLIRYLMMTRDVGIRFSPNPSKGLNAIATPISLAIGTGNCQHPTPAHSSLGAVG